MTTPHDTLFHTVFRHLAVVVSWLTTILPPHLAEALDWSTLATTSERATSKHLHNHLADRVFTVRWRANGAVALLVLEHKAFRDVRLHSQVLRQVVHLRRAHRSRNPDREPLVVAVLLWHAEGSPATLSHPDLAAFDAGTATAIAQLQPVMPMLVDDLGRHDEPTLRARGMHPLATLALLCLRSLRHFDEHEVLAAIDRWGDLLAAVERATDMDAEDALQAVGWYLLAVTDVPADDLHMAIEKHLTQPRGLFMSTLEKEKRRAHEEGRREILSTLEKEKRRAHEEGRAEGRTEGHQEGRTEGHQEGRTEGQARTLQLLLERRFGPLPEALQRRLHEADSQELDAFAERLLDARSAAEVFGG